MLNRMCQIPSCRNKYVSGCQIRNPRVTASGTNPNSCRYHAFTESGANNRRSVWTRNTPVQIIMILRMPGVSIPPQLTREPEPGYREREPIHVSLCACAPGVKERLSDIWLREFQLLPGADNVLQGPQNVFCHSTPKAASAGVNQIRFLSDSLYGNSQTLVLD